MINYNIYIESDEHPRTINTPMMARTNYTQIVVRGKSELYAKVAELHDAGEHITEVRTDLGTWIDISKVLVSRSLQNVVVAYVAEAKSRDKLREALRKEISKRQCFGHYLDPVGPQNTERMELLEAEYQRICARFRLYDRFGLPHYLDDLRKHALLVDEIVNGTLFLS